MEMENVPKALAATLLVSPARLGVGQGNGAEPGGASGTAPGQDITASQARRSRMLAPHLTVQRCVPAPL